MSSVIKGAVLQVLVFAGCASGQTSVEETSTTAQGPATTTGYAIGPFLSIGGTVAVGERHSCAIVNSRLRCWGGGDGTPREVDGLGEVVGVSVFGEHTCALESGGDAYCWNYGGDRPVRVRPLGRGLEVAAGARHACALLDDRSVWCWGANGSGQIGNDPVPESPELMRSTPPLQVVAIGDVEQVRCGGDYSCAIVDGGQVVCWGDNAMNQLGNRGLVNSRVVPVPVIGLDDAVHIDLHASFGCAARNDGSVWCWGGSEYDRVNSGPSRACVETLGDTTRVAIGGVTENGQSCALGRDGSLSCWGGRRRSGYGVEDVCDEMSSVSGLDRVVDVSIGRAHGCARNRNEEVLCWGERGFGRLGRGSGLPQIVIAPVPALDDAVQVASGAGFNCARRASGQVACWGRPRGCEPSQAESQLAELYELAEAAGSEDLVAVGNMLCARRGDGHVLCFRRSPGGDDPVCDPLFEPPIDLAPLRGAQDIALSYFGVAGILAGGRLVWVPTRGSEASSSAEEEPQLVLVGRVADAVEVDCAMDQCCVRQRSGEVTCWRRGERLVPGTGNRVQLAATDDAIALGGSNERVFVIGSNGSVTPVTTYGGALQPRDGIQDAVEVVGNIHVCARTRTGEVHCWGHNDAGQASTAPERDITTATRIGGLEGVVDLDAGENHSCAVRAGGDVVCWGSDAEGVLGSAYRPSNAGAEPVQGLGGGR